jgi:hypothetical protein
MVGIKGLDDPYAADSSSLSANHTPFIRVSYCQMASQEDIFSLFDGVEILNHNMFRDLEDAPFDLCRSLPAWKRHAGNKTN